MNILEKFERMEMGMIHWMCVVELSYRRTSVKLGENVTFQGVIC